MNILVLGATGTAGRSAVPVFVSAGHTVRTHVRSDAGAAAMAAMGAEPVRADLEDDQRLRRIVEGSDAVVDLRVAIPSTFGAALPWAWREYVRLRDRETRRLVDAALHAGTPRIVHDTVSMVYADGGDAELDEDSPVDAPGALAANLAAERHLARFTESGGTGVALRFGTFYGPHDEFSRDLMRYARRGWALLFGRPEAWTSAIHTDDLGPALLVALTAPAGVYNVVDDEPLRRRDLVAILANAAGVERVRMLPTWMSVMAGAPARALARSQRVRARRFAALGWRPSVPSRRQGWPEAFRAALDEPRATGR
ncbi:MAG TPA: NAD(P)-dependent oxidoreductase [Micromonosporaceae bacterium]|nr:NAD(P)-dependent oxidoreductase [Micromonosporaceae bacterium]